MNHINRRLPIYKQRALEHLALDQQLKIGGMAEDVLAFMVGFDQLPRNIDEQVPAADFDLASKLIQEEAKEFFDGFNKFEEAQSFENMTEMVDGAMDLIYVVLWAMLKMNIPVDACFAEVQRSNMMKLNDDGSFTKNEYGKVQKPAGWTPPDLHGILLKHFDTATWQGNIRKE
jgi:predicted HAD superfamily Cof-like phosphohydrolase